MFRGQEGQLTLRENKQLMMSKRALQSNTGEAGDLSLIIFMLFTK